MPARDGFSVALAVEQFLAVLHLGITAILDFEPSSALAEIAPYHVRLVLRQPYGCVDPALVFVNVLHTARAATPNPTYRRKLGSVQESERLID